MTTPNDQQGPGRPPFPKGTTAESQIQLRVTRKRKTAYVRAANKTKQTLAAWMFDACDAKAGYTEEPPQ